MSQCGRRSLSADSTPPLSAWTPESHQSFPAAFRAAVFQLLLIWQCRPQSVLAALPHELLLIVIGLLSDNEL